MKKSNVLVFLFFSFLMKGNPNIFFNPPLSDPRIDLLQKEVNKLDINGSKKLHNLENTLNLKLDKIDTKLRFIMEALASEDKPLIRILNNIKDSLDEIKNSQIKQNETPDSLIKKINDLKNLYRDNIRILQDQLNKVGLIQVLENRTVKEYIEKDIQSIKSKIKKVISQSNEFLQSNSNKDIKSNFKEAEFLYSQLKEENEALSSYLEEVKQNLGSIENLSKEKLDKKRDLDKSKFKFK